MEFDLYVWAAPRNLDDAAVAESIEAWEAAGGDPSASPFEPSTDVGWFARELRKDEPALDLKTDAVPNPSRTPIVLSGSDEPPARIVAIRLPDATPGEAFETIYSLAMKYDLLVFDSARRTVRTPLAEMNAYASATFWPAGAIRSVVVGGLAGIVAVAAWAVGIPVVSGVVAVIGGFMFVLAAVTLVAEGRKALRR